MASPSIAAAAGQRAADRPGARPEATRHSVDLPASLAPTTPTISPSARRQVDVVEDGLA